MIKRRKFIKGLSAAGLGLALPVSVFAQGRFKTTELGKNLSLISGAGCNVVVAEGPDSIVVVDGGLQENAEALLKEINRIAPGKPITTLFNTNWRSEHTGLNHLLGGSETTILAHENTRLWQDADFYVDWEDKHYQAMPKAAQANRSFYKTGSLILGDEIIEYGYLAQAHTDGDIYVHFVNANVLVVSDLLGVGAYPLMDYVSGGWIGGMQDASTALIARANANTKVIAADGPVQNRADLQAQLEMLTAARDKIGDSYRSGWSLEDFRASNPAADFGNGRDNEELFLAQLYRGTWYHVPGRAVRNVI